MIVIDREAMIRNVDKILNPISITLITGRFEYEVEGYGSTYGIKLKSNMDNELPKSSTASVLSFDNSKSTINSEGYLRNLHKRIDKSQEEFMYIEEILGYINELPYKQKYIVIENVLLKKSVNSICEYLKYSTTKFYAVRRIAKSNLAMLIPEAVEIKKDEDLK